MKKKILCNFNKKYIKYLEINLKNVKDLYTENYNALLKETEKMK